MSENEDFGSYLKHERELRGVALEDIADKTKIHLKYLEALENNLYDDLPGEVFVKGYIKSYAKSIGSDVEEIVNAYDDSIGRERRQMLMDAHSSKIKPKSAAKPALGLVFFALLLGGAAFGGFYYFNNVQENRAALKPKTPAPVAKASEKEADAGKEAPAAPVPQENAAAVEKNIATGKNPPEPEKPAVTEPKSEGFSNNFGAPNGEKPVAERETAAENPASEVASGDKKTSTVNEKGFIIQSVAMPTGNEAPPEGDAGEKAPLPLKLKIQARENAWFNLTVDDYREEDFILPAGLEKTFSGKEMFRITIGNKSNTHLFLNGKPVVLPEVPGEVVRDFIINASLLE